MAWVTATDPFVRFAIWTGATTSACIVLCCIAIALLRLAHLWQHHRLARQLPIWREAIAAGTLGETTHLYITRRDRWYFIKIWCQTHDVVRGDAREALKTFAQLLGMPKWALRLASHRRLRDRLLGISALGRINEFKGIEQLEALVNASNTIISLTAAEAYAHLVPSEALPLILHAASLRDDWPTSRLIEILHEVGPDRAKVPLLAAVATTHGESRKRLVPLLACLESRDTVDTVRAMLANQDDPETLAAALPLARPDDMPLIRETANNPAWFVRAKACQAIGEFGATEDLALLQKLLSDEAWWVRYRAAEALMRLPGVTRNDIRALANSHPDRYAREMLRMWLDSLGETS